MAKKPKFYAVVKGRKLGIFNTWDGGARLSIERFPEAKHQSFATLELAVEWYRQHSPTPGSNHSPVTHFSTEGFEKQPTAVPRQTALDGIGAKRYVIYLIIDPDTEEPFYVGLTTDLERRKQAHLGRARHNTKRAAAKIAEILDAGMSPIFKVVESCDSEEHALAAETRWVEQCTGLSYIVRNRWREHQDIQAVLLKPKLDLNQIIGDGPVLLGPYPYESRFELKKRLSTFLMKFSSGVIDHPMAMEKLKLIWSTTSHTGKVSEFRIVSGSSSHQLEAVLVSGSTVAFDYGRAIDRLP
ncbi:ribonuclease H [Pseudomonas syringae]|uniref:Ribonuclease H n=1 Tax=Pseudomonas syringae TaxID=317 RepID=A0A244EXL1_PSESX|nr:viroplasmin family protein [Pseudomonas syringae]OUM09224.1 ribonuclease H [Pseudomonas syringae]